MIIILQGVYPLLYNKHRIGPDGRRKSLFEHGDIILVAGIGSAVAGILFREVWSFFRWKRSLGRMERDEWSRVVRLLREK